MVGQRSAANGLAIMFLQLERLMRVAVPREFSEGDTPNQPVNEMNG